VVGEPVEHGVGQRFGGQNGDPLLEGQVRRHYDGPAFVSVGHDFEEEFRARRGQRNEAEFVQDEELDLLERGSHAHERPVRPRLDEGFHEPRDGEEADRKL